MNYDAAEAEQKWRHQWATWRIYRYDPERARSETFVVDTPPPTVSGSLHIGHVFSYTHQDLVVRFNRMRGRNIFYPMGWDDNGLPTERRVENYFHVRCDPTVPYDPGLKIQPQSSAPRRHVSRRNFIELCHSQTARDEEAYKQLWQRLGLSVDWNLEYSTISDWVRRISQFSLLQLIEKGEVYRATTPVAWDTTFRTTIAQAEIEDRESRAHFYRLRFAFAEGGECIVATTRPELLGACGALLVHPQDQRYVSYVGKTAITPLFQVPVPVFADERVVTEKGTGVVMVCTFGDATDVDWWRHYQLPLREVITPNGHLIQAEFGSKGWPSDKPELANNVSRALAGLDLERARQRIAQLLAENGCLDGTPEPIKHPVKFYEKGDRPLEIIMTKQWFIKLLDKKDILRTQGESIQWHPPFMLERYRNWVDGLNQDWCISRQRYFGVPFPVWYRCDKEGRPNYDKLIVPAPEQLPVDPMINVPLGFEPAQRDAPQGFSAESDVLDTWATSGLTPQILSSWVFDPKKHRRLFPMDLRPQAHEIIRTWAFYTIALAWMHEQTVPWRNIMISGWILDPDRKKMSKSKGNVVTPVGLLDTYSSDAVRYWAAKARAGMDTAYDETTFKVGRRLVTKLFNAGRFIFNCLQGVNAAQLCLSAITTELDRGIVDRLKNCVARATAHFEEYDWSGALVSAEAFFWGDLCDNYLEIVKDRVYETGLNPGKQSALATLHHTFGIILRLFAPMLPYICEELWSQHYATGNGRERSVHTSIWPEVSELAEAAPPADPVSYDMALEVVKTVRRAKAAEKRSMRWPVKCMTLRVPAAPSNAIIEAIEEVRSVGIIQQLVIETRPDLAETQVDVVLASEGDNRPYSS